MTLEPRYCGRFSYMSQDAVPGFGWIDEAEARVRYADPHADLTVIAPAGADGFAPWFINVKTGPEPGFMVVEQIAPGVPSEETDWEFADGQLFCWRVQLNRWPETSRILSRNTSFRVGYTEFRNGRDGNGQVVHAERGGSGKMETSVGQRKDIPVEMCYRPIPEWGRFDELLGPPSE